MVDDVLLLPGGVLPAELAYGSLIGALGSEANAIAKDLEVYAEEQPPPGYGLDVEVDGALAAADRAGFGRFHVVGYSAGGSVATALAALHPERLLSLALLEAAFIGHEGIGPEEQAVLDEFEAIEELPAEEMMPRFLRAQLAPGVEPPEAPPGPQPPWMARRPAGIRSFTSEFRHYEIDSSALRSFGAPALFVLGGRSNPDLYGRIAERCRHLFPDFRLEVFEERHHFDPPHRAEPERLAGILGEHWERAGALAG